MMAFGEHDIKPIASLVKELPRQLKFAKDACARLIKQHRELDVMSDHAGMNLATRTGEAIKDVHALLEHMRKIERAARFVSNREMRLTEERK